MPISVHGRYLAREVITTFIIGIYEIGQSFSPSGDHRSAGADHKVAIITTLKALAAIKWYSDQSECSVSLLRKWTIAVINLPLATFCEQLSPCILCLHRIAFILCLVYYSWSGSKETASRKKTPKNICSALQQTFVLENKRSCLPY